MATNQSKLFSVSCVDMCQYCVDFLDGFFVFFLFPITKSLKILFVVHQMSHKNVFKIRTKEKKEKYIRLNQLTTRPEGVTCWIDLKGRRALHTHTHTYIYIYI